MVADKLLIMFDVDAMLAADISQTMTYYFSSFLIAYCDVFYLSAGKNNILKNKIVVVHENVFILCLVK
jgi:hypothetical protein